MEAEKPVLLKNVAPYEGRGRASGATGYRRENGRVVAGFPFSGECSIQPGGEEHKEEEGRRCNEWLWPL